MLNALAENLANMVVSIWISAQHRLFSNVWKAYVDTQEEFSSVAKFCCLLIATLWSLSSYTHSVKSQKRTQIGTDDTKKNGVSFRRQFFCLLIATLRSLSSYTHNVEEPEKNQSKPEWSTTTDIHIHMRQYEVCFFLHMYDRPSVRLTWRSWFWTRGVFEATRNPKERYHRLNQKSLRYPVPLYLTAPRPLVTPLQLKSKKDKVGLGWRACHYPVWEVRANLKQEIRDELLVARAGSASR